MINQILGQIPFFSGLPPAELDHLLETVRTVTLSPGSFLFCEGDAGEHFYVILEGSVEIIKMSGTPEERVLGVRTAGEIIGEMGLINTDGRRTASVRAHELARFMEITRADFDGLLQRNPGLAYEMARVLSGRLNASNLAAIRDLQEKNARLTRAYEELKAAQVQIVEKERLEKELQVAYEIQMSILPHKLPRLPGYTLGARMVPARSVGGDLYDFVNLDEGRVGIVVGDVTDKGVPAAIFMAQTRALLRAETSRGDSPREALQRVNRHLLGMNEAGLFATVLYGILELRTGAFSYARAGHELPLLCAADGECQLPEEGVGNPLGILSDPYMDENLLQIPAGGTLLLYTDGVTETYDEAHEPLGLEGLRTLLCTTAGLPAQSVCDRLLERITDYRGGAHQHDDVTLVAVTADR